MGVRPRPALCRVNAAALASVCGTLHRLRDLNLAGKSTTGLLRCDSAGQHAAALTPAASVLIPPAVTTKGACRYVSFDSGRLDTTGMLPLSSECRYPRHCHASRHCLSHLPCPALPAPFFLPAGNSQLDAAALQHLQQLTLLSGLTVSSSSLNNQDLSAICSALPQLRHLDAGNNRITKADPLTALVSLTSLILSRNPLQLNCSKVLAGLPLQSLVLFSAAPARATSHLSGGSLTQQLTSLTLGADPSLFPEGTDESLQLAKTRTVGALFGALAEAGRLRVLSVPCTGLGDAQGKLLHKLGGSLQALNVRCGRRLQEGPGVCQVSQGLAVAAAFLRWPMGCSVDLNTPATPQVSQTARVSAHVFAGCAGTLLGWLWVLVCVCFVAATTA